MIRIAHINSALTQRVAPWKLQHKDESEKKKGLDKIRVRE